MAARRSAGCITFGVINILVALTPMIAGCVGSLATLGTLQPGARMDLQGRNVGPQFRQHIERNVPGALPEAFANAVISSFFGLLMMVGAIGLFMTHSWGRWLTLGAAVFLILTMCVHDIYQFAIFRPAVMDFLDQNLGNMPNDQRTGFKIGFTASYFFWSCFNPLVMIYLFAMCLFLCLTSAFNQPEQGYDDEPPLRRRRRGRDDDDDGEDDEPRRRRRGWRDEEDDD